MKITLPPLSAFKQIFFYLISFFLPLREMEQAYYSNSTFLTLSQPSSSSKTLGTVTLSTPSSSFAPIFSSSTLTLSSSLTSRSNMPTSLLSSWIKQFIMVSETSGRVMTPEMVMLLRVLL